MTTWTIRKAQPADANALRDLVQDAYRHYIDRMGQKPGPMLDDYENHIAHHQVWLAVQAGRLIGGLVLMAKGDHLLLDNIAVLPSAQGLGVGHALLTLADDEARAQGFNQIQLYTHRTMTENIALYKKLGWREMDRRTDGPFERIYMCKAL